MNFDLKPLQIGPLTIEFPIVLAALASYSDLPYRLICRSLGAPFCATEAMLDRQLLLEGKLRDRLVKLDAADHPIAGQLMGSDPAAMAQAAASLRDLGFDVIDLNFACPVKKVVAKKRGGYLMDKPELALDIVKSVIRAVPDRPVTLKLRRTFRETDETNEAFWKISQAAFEAGAAAIAVHARSVGQKYRGDADWDFIARVKKAFPGRTILGSGDVRSAAEALRLLETTGADGVLAARGAIGNPWFFRQARDLAAGRSPFLPDLEEQRRVIEAHLGLAVKTYGERRGLLTLRNFGIHYARLHPHPAKVRAAFIGVKTERDWRSVMENWYGAPPFTAP